MPYTAKSKQYNCILTMAFNDVTFHLLFSYYEYLVFPDVHFCRNNIMQILNSIRFTISMYTAIAQYMMII